MPADLDHLLRSAAEEPNPIDVDELWSAGRRRRLVRRVAAASTAVAVVAVVGVGIASLAGAFQTGSVEIDPITQPAEPPPERETAEDPEATADDSEDRATVDLDDTVTQDAPADADSGTDADAGEDARAEPPDDTASDVTSEPDEAADAGPEPDAAAVADPCARHGGREGEAFLDVVAPVDGQHVAETVQLVGCSNVYEATVRYQLTTAAGDVVVDSFTTATCGNACVGEFRTDVEAPDGNEDLTLTVFWDDASDGSKRDVVTRTLVRD